MVTASDIINSPAWYLHSIDLDQARFLFVKTNHADLSSCSFLDHRFDVQSLPRAEVSITDLHAHANSINSCAPRFVFHTAFCCSTLVARCLDLESANLSLKEPAVLMELANAQRIGHPLLANPVQAHAIYNLITKLLFRPFGNGQTVLVKPTNTVNNIIQQMMATHPDSKALLLHSDLESFLISILKKGEQGRSFARQLFTIFLMDSAEARQLDSTRLMRMTDTQIAAITWHLQLETFFDVFASYDSTKVKSLHCDRLLSNPRDSLASLIDFFGFDALAEKFDYLVDNAPLQQNAKDPGQKFDSQNRSQEYTQARDKFSATLNTIIPWAEQLHFKHAYSNIISNPI